MSQRCAGWTRWDWVGFATLLVGAAVIVSAFLGHRSLEWLISTRLYKDRMFDLGFNAAGALTIGLGVLPVVAGLAVALASSRASSARTRESALSERVPGLDRRCFGLYTR